MFTDVVGYSKISARDESKALELLGLYRRVMQSVFPMFEGQVIKTMGDGFLVEFASAVEAVNCAVEAQKRMHDFNSSRGPDERVMIRIGIHVGDVVHSGGDVLGDAVNIASRVEPLAEPGEVCMTRQVVDQIEGKLKWKTVSIGVRQLKNIPNPVEIFKVATGEGGLQTGQRVGLDTHRIAILPFSNLSPDPGDKYLADGMTEELISTVSRIRDLSVISRTSAMRYKDTSLPMEQIGRELGVGAILEGSVRKAGDKVRITAQLIRVDADRYIWSQSYDRDLSDILGLQGEIAQHVAEGLKIQILSGDRKRLEKKATTNPQAYTAYLKGRSHWSERSEQGTRKAIRCFEDAASIDPGYAPAYSGLADCYAILADYGWMEP